MTSKDTVGEYLTLVTERQKKLRENSAAYVSIDNVNIEATWVSMTWKERGRARMLLALWENWPTSEEVDQTHGRIEGLDRDTVTLDGVEFETVIVRRKGQMFEGEPVYVGPDLIISERLLVQKLLGMRHRGAQGLRYLRKVAGVSRATLASRLEVKEEDVLAWESGEVSMSDEVVETYHQLAQEALEKK